MADMNCRACGAWLSAGDRFCGDCGAKIEHSAQQPPGARPASSPPLQQSAQVATAGPTQPQIVHVYGATQQGYYQPPPSVAFAIITLVFYFVLFPVGALLNLIGIFTGPRRGCFAAMLFFILLPTTILIGVTIAIFATGADQDIERFLRDKMQAEWAPNPHQNMPPMDDVLIPDAGLRAEPPTN